MIGVYLALAALVILGTAMVLIGRWDAGMTASDRPAAEPLPDGAWGASDVENLRFRVGLRGYRMEDVDAALRALAAELRRRDAGEGGSAMTPSGIPHPGGTGLPAPPEQIGAPSTARRNDLSAPPSDLPGTSPGA